MCRRCWSITVKEILNGEHLDSEEAMSSEDVTLCRTEEVLRLLELSILLCATEMTLIGTIS